MSIDWHTLVVPTVSLAELFLRGSAVYLVIFAAMRFLRRESGALSTADVLVVVLVADAAQNAMAAEYHSLTEGLVLVATIFGWNYFLDWLAFRFEGARRILQAGPLLLVQDGRIQAKNLRAEFLTKDDLAAMLREHGVGSPAQVRRCYLEADGRVSVIRRDDGPVDPPDRRSLG
jgi:uncharacterized membrane protein YcaP (DUF421 family)